MLTDEGLTEHFDSYDHEICPGAKCEAIKYLRARMEAAEKTIQAWEEFSLQIHARIRNKEREFRLRMAKADATVVWRKSKGE